jgi:ribosomal protein S18 acetylase RimI-like enzyme
LTAQLRPLEPGDESWLADLHNRAFSDYALPARLDASALATYMAETGVRHDLSFAAFVDGHPASFCLGALREDRASVRGEGTDPGYRRRGLGAEVLDATVAAATAAGAREISLEVLDGNEAALELYERHGFRRRRQLLGYELDPPRVGIRARIRGGLNPLPGADAARLLALWGWPDPPWQLAPASLERLPAFTLAGEAVVVGRRRGSRFWLYALAVDPERRGKGVATRTLAALGAETIAIPALVPEEWDAAHGFLETLGGVLDQHRQWEMTRGLGA